MINSLENKYNKEVFHISGYSFLSNSNSKRAVFSRFMNCWVGLGRIDGVY